MPKGEKFLSKNDVPVCFLTSFSKKRPHEGGPSLGRNSNSMLYFYWTILSEFDPDCGLCVAQGLLHSE